MMLGASTSSILSTSPDQTFPHGKLRAATYVAEKHSTDAIFPNALVQVSLRTVAEGLRANLVYRSGAKQPLGYRSANVEYYVIKGALKVVNPRTREEQRLTAGMHLMLPANFPHSIVALEDSEALFLSPVMTPTLSSVAARDSEVE